MELTFSFSSGAGAWITSLTLLPDGAFSDEYHDSDMDVIQLCQFWGAFSMFTPLDGLLSKAFEKLASGVLTDGQFQQLSGRYAAEQAECQVSIARLEAERQEQEEGIQKVSKFLDVVDRYLDIQELTTEILHEFVVHIVAHKRSERWKKKHYTQ